MYKSTISVSERLICSPLHLSGDYLETQVVTRMTLRIIFLFKEFLWSVISYAIAMYTCAK